MSFQSNILELERLNTNLTETTKHINAKIDEAHNYRETLMKMPAIDPQSVDKLNDLNDELINLHSSEEECRKQIAEMEKEIKDKLSLLAGKKVVFNYNHNYTVSVDENDKLVITD